MVYNNCVSNPPAAAAFPKPFVFADLRHAYRDLCDVPAGDRTDDQRRRHHALGELTARFKALVPMIEAVRKLTDGKLSPLVYSENPAAGFEGKVPFETPFGPTDVEAELIPAFLVVLFGATGAVVLKSGDPAGALKALLVGVEAAR